MPKLIATPAPPYNLSAELIGGKAYSLQQLLQIGVNVPKFRVLTTRAFRYWQTHPYRFEQKCLQLFQTLHGMYSVRSSASFEDTHLFSLAGQLETVLAVQSPEKIYQAVQTVYASVQHKHVQTYLQKFVPSPQKHTIAAIIQKMVFPQISGVVFTQHPLQPHSDFLFIEIVTGSCDNLVSGKTDPEHITFDRAGNVLNKSSDRFDAYLHKLQELVQIALKIEQHYKIPQDIEWGIEHDQIWILQSRPITHSNHSQIVTDQCGTSWTDYFYAERFTEPVSPLGWSFLKYPIEKAAFRDTLWFLGKKSFAQPNMTRLIQGRPYTNLDAFQQIYSVLPLAFISADKVKQLQLTHQNWFRNFLATIPFLVSRLCFRDLQWIPEVNLRKWRWIENNFAKKMNTLKANLDENNLEKSIAVFNQTQILSNEFLENHRWAITFADIFTDLLKKYLAFHQLDISTNDLLGGLKNQTVAANLALENLDIHNSALIDEFLQKYGHRAKSLDIYQETWHEHFDILKNVNINSSKTLLASFNAKVKLRKQLEQDIKQYLKSLPLIPKCIYSFIFYILNRYSKAFTLLRENQRNLWQQLLALARQSVLYVADTLCEQKILDERNLIFFTKKDEFIKLAQHPAFATAVIAKARLRLLKYQAWNSEANSQSYDNSQSVYHGLSVSNDCAVGHVHVAKSYTEAFQCKPGDILVVRSADPAWSPVFQLASGLIMETGGVLSHASIVAREFGLATVTGIRGATEIFKNGELVRVDGRAGKVFKLAGETIDSNQ